MVQPEYDQYDFGRKLDSDEVLIGVRRLNNPSQEQVYSDFSRMQLDCKLLMAQIDELPGDLNMDMLTGWVIANRGHVHDPCIEPVFKKDSPEQLIGLALIARKLIDPPTFLAAS